MMFAKLLARDIRLGFVRLLPYYIGAVLLGLSSDLARSLCLRWQ